jgi:hypothetical protein
VHRGRLTRCEISGSRFGESSPQSLPFPLAEAVATLAAHTQPGSSLLPSPISIPVPLVPQTRPPRAPPSTSGNRASTRRSSPHRTRFLQVPVSRNCALRHGSASPTSTTSVSLSATHAAPSLATQPVNMSLTTVRAAQPLVPLAVTVHAIAVTCQEAPRSTHANPRRTPPTPVAIPALYHL